LGQNDEHGKQSNLGADRLHHGVAAIPSPLT